MAERAVPQLTAVVMVDGQRERGARAVKSICAQQLDGGLELILVDFSEPGTPPLAGSDHPAVRVMRGDVAWGYGGTLARAAQEARAPIVAFVEEHVVVLDGWAQALVEAHKGPWAAVSSEMHAGDLGRAVADRVELVSRNRWSAPAQRGPTDVLRWQNVCYKRESLMRYGDRLPLFLSSESILFRQLRKDGGELFIEPAAKIVHDHELTWGVFLRGSFHSARLGAASGVKANGSGIIERLAQAARRLVGLVRWPFVLWKRTQSLPEQDQWLPCFRRNLLFVCQYYFVNAFGGMLGALAGEGGSNRAFLLYELNEGRHQPTSRRR